MPTLGVFGELQVGSGALQHQVKVHGFLSAHSNDIQGDKNLGVATFVVFEGCLKPVLCLEDAEKSYSILQICWQACGSEEREFLARPGCSAELLRWPRAVLFLVHPRLPMKLPGTWLFCTGFLDKRWPVLSTSLLCPILSKNPDASLEAGRCHTPASGLPSFFSISEQ